MNNVFLDPIIIISVFAVVASIIRILVRNCPNEIQYEDIEPVKPTVKGNCRSCGAPYKTNESNCSYCRNEVNALLCDSDRLTINF